MKIRYLISSTMTLVLFVTVSTIPFGCSKDSESRTTQEPPIEIGTYIGLLGNSPTLGNNILDFKVEVTKIGERKYSIRQITSSTLPTFYFTVNTATNTDDIQLEQGGYYKCTIPQQASGTATIIGDGVPNGEEDAGYYVPQKRLTFTIQINNTGYRVAFSGVKQ